MSVHSLRVQTGVSTGHRVHEAGGRIPESGVKPVTLGVLFSLGFALGILRDNTCLSV